MNIIHTITDPETIESISSLSQWATTSAVIGVGASAYILTLLQDEGPRRLPDPRLVVGAGIVAGRVVGTVIKTTLSMLPRRRRSAGSRSRKASSLRRSLRGSKKSNSPLSFPERKKRPGDPSYSCDECAICSENLNNIPRNRTARLTCGHKFCKYCIKQWSAVQKRGHTIPHCPACRQRITGIIKS